MLEPSMALLKQLFEENPIPMIIIEMPSGRIIEANSSALQFYHYSAFELPHITINQIHANVLDEINLQIKKRSPFKIETSYLDHNFTLHHLVLDGQMTIYNGITYVTLRIAPVTNPLAESLVHNIDAFDFPHAMVIVDKRSKVMSLNDAFTFLFGYSKEQVLGATLPSLLSLDGDEKDFDDIFQTIFNGGVVTKERERKTLDGESIPVSIIGVPLIVEGKIEGAQIFYMDHSVEHQARKELQLFKEIINNYGDGVIVADKNKNIHWVNPSFTRITGYRLDEVQGKNPRILSSGIQSKEFYNDMWKEVFDKGHFQGQLWNRKKNGDIFPQLIDLFTIRDPQTDDVKNYISIFKNLDEIESVDRKILLMLQKDPLTQLYNRTYFLEESSKILKDQSSTSYLLFLDINNYKPINDTHGHYIGDKVLVKYAHHLLETFHGQMIGRFGGDEFLILFNHNASLVNVKKAIASFNPVIEINGETFTLSTSIGIVETPTYGTDIQELINKADEAMYQSKRKGTRYSVYKKSSRKKS